MKPTPEQHGVKEAACAKKNLIVRSFAGTGKTTTTQYVIENICSSNTPVLYLTFAVSNVEEAKQKMGHIEGLKITNIHKLAFETVGCLYANKLGDMSVRDYKNLLKSTTYDVPMTVKKAITAFINSTDKTLQKKHVPTVKTYNYKQIGLNPKVVELSFKFAKQIWDRMVDPSDNLVKMPHDGYLKLYCLRKETIDEWKEYSTVIVDEAQDQNVIVLDVEERFIAAQGHLLKVGDDHQNLYRFRGCSNGMETFVNDDRFEVHQLTQSFRFGPRIAELSKAVLKVKGSYAELKGTDTLDTHIRPPGYKIEGQRVVLHRTAAGVLRTSLNLYQRQIPFIVVGGLAKYFTKELAWFEKIKKGDTKGIPKNFLATYPTWKAVVNVEEKTKDPELTRVIKIIKLAETLKLGNLYNTINHIDEISIGVTNPTAILSTIHKFKGLEHDNTVLSDDFLEFSKLQKLTGDKLEDEINALYVAVTRAMKNLVANSLLTEILKRAGKINLMTGSSSPYA
ncbi:UvrD-helicase domain-containing protein [Vibrio sp. 10N.239.312.D08]|uniref:UvrD-helicase domain-containing protein n=1 Tax=Vibrio sp. 10N.239.312.D08 TaxID=3229978 RepID=UPI0035522246